jgi:hypothetical protein
MNKKIFTLLVAVGLGTLHSEARENSRYHRFLPALSTESGKKDGVNGKRHGLRGSPVFIENAGQVKDQHGKPRTDIDFKVESPVVGVYIGKGAIHYQWSALQQAEKRERSSEKEPGRTTWSMYRMDVQLLQANVNAVAVTEDKQPYFEQELEGAGLKRAYAYKKVTYKDVYPHIDWVFYFNADGKMEHDFIIHPGGKVSDIQLKYGGATKLRLNKNGSLLAETPMGTVTEAAPRSFAGNGTPVPSSFALRNNVLSFRTGAYIGTLTIDPTLEWGTFYGGTGDDHKPNLANDPDGNIYMSFATSYSNPSVNIVTTGAYQLTRETYNDDYSPFLVKFDSTGQRLWATHFGKSVETLYPRTAPSISCDPSGNIFIMADTMFAKFDATGQLSWAKGLPGYTEFAYRTAAIQCDPSGNVYMTGIAHAGQNTVFGTAGTYKDTVSGGYDVFLMKYNSAGTRLWGTFFGGEGGEENYGGFNPVICDPSGNVFLTGRTQSLNGITTAGCYQSVFGGETDAFLAKFNDQGQLLWSTYYGGEQVENGGSLAADQVGNVFLAANTKSETGISSANSFQDTLGGGNDFFVAKFNGAGERLWATYYGGEGEEIYNYNGGVLDCDPFGNVVLYGFTNSPDGISSPGSYQENIMSGGYTIFLAKLDGGGQRLWGTYFGGTGGAQIGGYASFYGPNSGGGDISCDAFGNIYISNSAGPQAQVTTPGSYQPAWGGGYPNSMQHDVFVTKFSDCAIAIAGNIEGDSALCANTNTAIYSINPVPGAVSYDWILPAGWQGSSAADTIEVTLGSNGGVIGVVVVAACGGTDTAWKHVVINPVPAPVISRNGNVLSTGSFASYQWYRNNSEISGATASSYVVTATGAYTVKVTNASGCPATSAALDVQTLNIGVHSIADDIRIYPNPSGGLVRITSPVKVNITLNSVEGRQLMARQEATELDLGSCAEGIYLLKIYDIKDRLIKTVKLHKAKQ